MSNAPDKVYPAYFQAPAETSGEVCPDDGDWGVRDSENTSNLFSKKIVGTLLAPPTLFDT